MDDVDDAGGVDELGNEDVCKKERETGNAGAAPVLPATTTMSPLTVKSILSACSSMGACMHAGPTAEGRMIGSSRSNPSKPQNHIADPRDSIHHPGALVAFSPSVGLLPPTTFL